jgi:hypothetical protein
MCSNGVVVDEAAGAALAGLADTCWDTVSVADRLAVLERLETLRRRVAMLSHDVIASLAAEDIPDLGPVVHRVIADRLRITPGEARRRMRDAEQLRPRTTLTGQRLAPELAGTADQWRAGALDGEHLKVIQRFMTALPVDVDAPTREAAETFFAEKAAVLRPDQLTKVADRLAITINPDGNFTDVDRARRRGFTWRPQGPDGMSEARLVATPALRAELEAWLAKFAAPGMCNPGDESPCTSGEASAQRAEQDGRTPRNATTTR